MSGPGCKGLRTALATAALALLAGCQSLGGATDALQNLVGPSTQSQFKGRYVDQQDVRQYYRLDPQHAGQLRLSFDGRTLPADEIRQQNVVRIPELEQYLQGIVTRLVKGWPGQAPTLQVRIVDSYGFGPSADPYGTLFVPLGMLENVKSEDEIAAMLGHEMSHVLMRHHDRRVGFIEQKALMTTVASTVMIGAALANTGYDRDSKAFFSKNPERLQKTVGQTALYTALINSFSDNVWSTAWGRTQEDQADLLGTDLMIRAGYAPRASSISLQRLGNFQGKQKPLLTSFLEQRQAAITDSVKQLDVKRTQSEIHILINQSLGTALKSTGDYLTRSHMSPTQRDEDLRLYLQREYKEQTRARVDRHGWPKVRDAKAVQRALQGYRDAYAATAALDKKQTREAAAFIERALASPVAAQPGIRRAAFAVHMAQGKRRAALADLQAIQDWSLASPSIYQLIIDHHLADREPQAALAMIDKAERHLGSEELFITEKLLATKQLKDEARIQQLLSKCDQYASRKEACRKIVPKSA